MQIPLAANPDHGRPEGFGGKGPQVGNNVSHANNKTKRRFMPNLQSVRAQMKSGEVKRVRVCTQCIRSGAVLKPAAN